MLSGSQRLFCKRCVCVGVGGHDDELRVGVGEEVLRCAVVSDVGKVDFAVGAGRCRRRVDRRLGSLQDRNHLVVIVRRDKWEVEALGGKAVAHDTDFDS